LEIAIVCRILDLLSDKNGEVKSLAASWSLFLSYFFAYNSKPLLFLYSLKILILKVRDSQKELIISHLCRNILSEDENLRDISFMGSLFF
jgi:hypothetical protein